MEKRGMAHSSMVMSLLLLLKRHLDPQAPQAL
jgi:hypothetical protein